MGCVNCGGVILPVTMLKLLKNTFYAEGVVFVNFCSCRFTLSIEVTSSFCRTVFKAATPRCEVTVLCTGGVVVDRKKTLDGAPARNITSIVGVLDGTC